jgi:hypothetical protein
MSLWGSSRRPDCVSGRRRFWRCTQTSLAVRAAYATRRGQTSAGPQQQKVCRARTGRRRLHGWRCACPTSTARHTVAQPGATLPLRRAPDGHCITTLYLTGNAAVHRGLSILLRQSFAARASSFPSAVQVRLASVITRIHSSRVARKGTLLGASFWASPALLSPHPRHPRHPRHG